MITILCNNTTMLIIFNFSGFCICDKMLCNCTFFLHSLADMMGPFIENLEGKIQKPYGCGEQNIKSLTPSIFVGPYLEAINKLDQETKNKLKRYCEQGTYPPDNYKFECR